MPGSADSDTAAEMNVDVFNTYTTGGAAMAALRLHASLRSHGVASRFWYKQTRHPQDMPAEYAQPLKWPTGCTRIA